MKTMHLLRGILCLTAFMALLPLSAQHNKDINLRWGVTAGMNGFNANSLNLSDHRGRYGFNIAARAELDFANSMYLDAELGLLNLGWKNRVSYYYSDYYNPDTPIGDYTETDFTQRMNAYYLHLPIHAGYHWSVARRCAIYVDAGPYFSLGLFGKAKTTDHIKNETHKTIWCWTGFLYEEILADPHLSMLLPYIDVLVDGPFIQEKKDRDLLFRGSSNQRIIYLSGKEEDIIPGTVPLVPVK